MKRRSKAGSRGFTLIEIVIVICIMMVLLSIAIPMYSRQVEKAKEAKFLANLTTLNNVIEQYSEDKHQAPQTLDDLVDAGYLKLIPDDITGSNSTWQTENEQEPEKAWNPDQMGIASVHSGSDQTGSDGRPYSAWGTAPPK
jgi:general secretion pathway protein G